MQDLRKSLYKNHPTIRGQLACAKRAELKELKMHIDSLPTVSKDSPGPEMKIETSQRYLFSQIPPFPEKAT